LQDIVHSIALDTSLALLFSKERDEDLMQSARKAGATTVVRIEAIGLVNGVRTNLRPVTVTVPYRRISRAAINGVHRTFRDHFKGGPRDVEILEYRLVSEDASHVYATWQRLSSTTAQSSSAGKST